MLGQFSDALRKHYSLASIMSSLEGFPVFQPARSISQAQYSEIMERLALTWLTPEQRHNLGVPTVHEETVVQQGDMQSLHHIIGFFTPEHAQLLANAAKTTTCVYPSLRACALEIHRKPKQAANNRLLITNGEQDKLLPAPVLYSARAEIAAAWLITAVLPDSQATKTSSNKSNGASSSSR